MVRWLRRYAQESRTHSLAEVSVYNGYGPSPAGKVRIPYGSFSPNVKVTSFSIQDLELVGDVDGALREQAVAAIDNRRKDKQIFLFMFYLLVLQS